MMSRATAQLALRLVRSDSNLKSESGGGVGRGSIGSPWHQFEVGSDSFQVPRSRALHVVPIQDAIRNGFHDVADELEAHGAVISPDLLRKFVKEAVDAGDTQVRSQVFLVA